MKNYIAPLLFIPALVAPAASTSAQQQGMMEQVLTHMKAVSTMSANFTQTDRNGQTLTGKFLLKRPGHARFEYQDDVPLLIVADGRSLTLIDYEVKQVQRWPIRNSPLSALLDPGQDLGKYGRLVPTSSDNVISVEVRDPKRPEFGLITMVFVRKAGAPGGLTLNGWVALDSQNNRTTIRLSDIKFNTGIPDSNFTWRDPRPRKRI